MKEYLVLFNVYAYYEKRVLANSIEEAKTLAEQAFSEAKNGDFYDVDGEIAGIVNIGSEKATELLEEIPEYSPECEEEPSYITIPEDEEFPEMNALPEVNMDRDKSDKDILSDVDLIIQAYNFATAQTADGLADIGFRYKDVFITNPWMDRDGLYPITFKEALSVYGKENVSDFIRMVDLMVKQTKEETKSASLRKRGIMG